MGFSKFLFIISMVFLLGGCGVTSKDDSGSSVGTFEAQEAPADGTILAGGPSETASETTQVPCPAGETCDSPPETGTLNPRSELDLSADRPYGAILQGPLVLKCGDVDPVPQITFSPGNRSLSGKIFLYEQRELPENAQLLIVNVGPQDLRGVPCSWSDYWDYLGRALLGGNPLVPLTLQNETEFRGDLSVNRGDLLIFILTETVGRPMAADLNWRDVMPFLQDGYWLGAAKVQILDTAKAVTLPTPGISQAEDSVAKPKTIPESEVPEAAATE